MSPSNSPPSSPVFVANKKTVAPDTTTTTTTRVASPPGKRPRDKKTNAEASKLRNVISMTDYEITRLTKSLKKRMGTLQSLEAQHHGHPEDAQHSQSVLELNNEIQSLHVQIGRLTVRQQGLKDEYLELTGKHCCSAVISHHFSRFEYTFKTASPQHRIYRLLLHSYCGSFTHNVTY